ncbi:hypothetical protein HD554DRAFT_2040731 [Boletus coccyginus]|nr:hypothetical protein HD554DRAFT_2040731 [Boletus coccyginus]
MPKSLLKALPFEFTKFLGRRKDAGDTKFNDAIGVGGFPFEQKIDRIKKVELFSKGTSETNVLDGLKISYKMVGKSETDPPVVVEHGIVTGVGVVKIGSVEVNGRVSMGASEHRLFDVSLENQILVGASGQVKNLPGNPEKHERISTTALSVYSKRTGKVNVDGEKISPPCGLRPYGNTDHLGGAWGSFGPIVAFQGTFQGTKVTDRGLTTLGFIKATQGDPDAGIFVE